MAILILLGTASSCSDEGADPEAAVNVIAEDLRAGDDARVQVTAEEAECVASSVVDRLGMGRLEELGLDTSSDRGPRLYQTPLNDVEGDRVFAAFDDCLDFATRLFQDGDMPEAQARCVAASYIESGLLQRSMLMKTRDPEFNQTVDDAVAEAIATC